MIDISTLMCGVIFGSIGFGFFLYGRKQKAMVPLLSGMALMLLPFFIPNVYLLVSVSIILMVLPYFIRQ